MKKIFIILFIFSLLIILPHKVSAISTFIKYPGNPIVSFLALKPSVVLVDGKLKMWYNTDLQIEYAESTDGINWVQYVNNPVLVGNNDPLEVGVQEPSVIFDNGTYEMWYTTYPSLGPFAIRFATSNDGVSWNKQGAINLPIQQWENGSHIEPWVLKVGEEYRMWYTSNDGHWKISYATSDDGINWVPYANNPVLVGTESWEDIDVAGASVMYDGTLFEMYYHSAGAISYATSTDGIHWDKPADKNPVIASSSGWDTNELGPSAVKLPNGTTLLYYSSFGNNTWRVGLAYNGSIDLPTPTPSSTPTPTVTPTPTASSTPTPTPTITPPINKVIIIPGFGGSMNEDAIAGCKEAPSSDDWTSWQLSEPLYRNLTHSLTTEGYIPLTFFYDWRKQPNETAGKLKTFIDEHTSPGEHVYIVAHSMGGQIARAYIEQEQTKSKVSKLMTVGTPHQGIVFTYPIWSGGEIQQPIQNILWRVALYVQLLACRINGQSGTDTQIIHQIIPSVQTFLPTFDYLIHQKTKEYIPVEFMMAKNPWLLSDTLFQPPYYGITVGTLSGNGVSTLKTITTKNPTAKELSNGIWIDGKPQKYSYNNQGDGLVLKTSSQLLSADNRVIPGSHSEIISSKKGLEQILSFLRGNTSLPQLQVNSAVTEPKNIMAIVSTESQFKTEYPNRFTKDRSKIHFLIDQNEGDYALKFDTSPKGILIVIQISGDSPAKINTYKLNSSNKTIKLKLQKNPLNNPMLP